ncbi:MAG: toll/interleukin-1 receptor domain-containing protein [Planctomycetota bacterium]
MQAFISYSREDDTFADLMRMKLKEAGIGTWMDVDTSPGDEWRTRIDDGIKTSDALIVVLSPAACNSPYVTYEWAFAIGYGKRVIPVLLKPAKFHPRLEEFQYLDFQELRMAPWDKLVPREGICVA